MKLTGYILLLAAALIALFGQSPALAGAGSHTFGPAIITIPDIP
ncbi:hypothetical protein PEL8287_00789 [Roseovarius litorisediminis]|uniref:Uncharacterized protein n=1 Tax=Roseovarius litorisediminis TaxID=1312363 RepID=A0A1Y5RLV0_9RHOB|nr:hypothetical protein [Roseovarius litorisediminis]SLN19401.1 hypothetical protein PEL8287_00789 [Roseovarius litorisediminis]